MFTTHPAVFFETAKGTKNDFFPILGQVREGVTIITLFIGTPLLTILVLKLEIVHSTTS